MHYFVYVKDLIAVETEQKDFKWTFGQSPRSSDKESFEKSLIRVHFRVEKDKHIAMGSERQENITQFSSFFVSSKEREISFKKSFLKTVTIAFKLKIDGNDIYFSVGRVYYNLVKLRIMNTHSARFILSDVVSGLLLINHYAPLYCAAVSAEEKLIMIFGGPATGKTLSATQLIKRRCFSLLSEDVSVTDGATVWSVPFTSTYGQHNKKFTLKKSRQPICDELVSKTINRKYIFLLEKGKEETSAKIPEKITLLNRYIFHYDNSPITAICAYFFDDYRLDQMRNNEKEIVRKLCDDSMCAVLRENDSARFVDRILKSIDSD